MKKINWAKKLSSRKFWAAVAGFITMLLVALGVEEGTVTQVSALILSGGSLITYIVMEGKADAANIAAEDPEDPGEWEEDYGNDE